MKLETMLGLVLALFVQAAIIQFIGAILLPFFVEGMYVTYWHGLAIALGFNMIANTANTILKKG